MSKSSLPRPALVWLRDDLRLDDNPAIAAAVASGRPLLLVYVQGDASDGVRPLGGAAKWWLHHALAQLADAVHAAGARLDLFTGDPAELIHELARSSAAECAYWNRRYGGAERGLDAAIEARLRHMGVEVVTAGGHLMHEPWDVTPKGGGSFKVFTPFWRAAQALPKIARPTPAAKSLKGCPYPAGAPHRTPLNDLALLPTSADWAAGWSERWEPGEKGGAKALSGFVDHRLDGYGTGRDRPDIAATSRLSPHLRFGDISVRRVYWTAADALAHKQIGADDVAKFHSELAWRDFNYNILFEFPELQQKSFQSRFESFPWQKPENAVLRAWKKGKTGYPIVDAGMRELWTSGYMHNRVRMITGSFLVKHLLIDWRKGEEWFWDCLCDADLASNTANWQWVAGSGADAAPYFRIFNPILQGKRFDPEGDYVRHHVPELAKLSKRWIHEPWKAPQDELRAAGIVLGESYSLPMVDHDEARKRALAAFQTLNSQTHRD